jgi:hypothetical protein
MGAMPYMVEKGRVFSVYEDYLSSMDRRLAMLANVRTLNVPMWEALALASPNLRSPPFDLPNYEALLKQHTQNHWHGAPTFAGGTWNYPPINLPTLPATTGWWKNWTGPAEGILRNTFLRAIEVSLGLVHADPVAKNPVVMQPPHAHTVNGVPNLNDITRFWPIEFLWICGAPTLQGWVTWRKTGNGFSEGQVTVIFSTPPAMGVYAMYNDPEPGTGAPPDSFGLNYATDPGTVTTTNPLASAKADVNAERGMWVIGAKKTVTIAVNTTTVQVYDIDWDGDPDIVIATTKPSSRYVATDSAVQTVRPSEFDGGVLSSPTKF